MGAKKQVGDLFGLQFDFSGPRTSECLFFVARVVRLLQKIDSFLLSHISYKIKKVHYRLSGDSYEKMFFFETFDTDEKMQKIIHKFLRKGREVLLSKVSTIESRATFENVMVELAAIISEAEQDVSDNYNMKHDNIVLVQKKELAKLIEYIWNVWKNMDESQSLSILSLSGNPKVFFKMEPDFKNWIKIQNDNDIHHGWVIIDKLCFNDPKSWKGYLISGGCKQTINMNISDPKFLEKIVSCESNKTNGLLNGDTYLCGFRIETDIWGDKPSYIIVTVEDKFRADQITQQDQFAF